MSASLTKLGRLRALQKPPESDDEYWRKKLAGDVVLAGIPSDYARRPRQSERTKRLEVLAGPPSADLFAGVWEHNPLKALAILIAALKIGILKYSGQTDLTIFVPARNKSRANHANCALAIRNRIDPKRSLREFLGQVTTALLEAYDHARCDFEELAKLLRESCDPTTGVVVSVTALCDPEAMAKIPGDVAFLFDFSDGVVSVQASYDPSLFQESSIRVFAEQLFRIFETVLTSPDQRISALTLISAEDAEESFREWQEATAVLPNGYIVPTLFQQQAAKTPLATALIVDDSVVTYERLDQLASRAKERLIRAGVQPRMLVGICLHHSVSLVAAMLGIWRAGAAYVPLDPGAPREWLASLVQTTGMRFAVTSRNSPPLPGVETIVMADSDEEAYESVLVPVPESGPADVAYVIFTSGSTGEPKGVQIEHRALLNYIWWARSVYCDEKRPVFSLYSSAAFDLTVTSLFVPLICGGALVIYSNADGAPSLNSMLSDGRTTHLKLTPSHLGAVAEQDNHGCGIRTIIVGGEALTTELARRTLASFGAQVAVYNEYGPTEATVGCMIHRFDPANDCHDSVPIGRAAANIRIYILDEQLNPLPANIPGELYIAGNGLARGYVNRPALTAEKFLPDPFAVGERMYRSGDWARRSPGGVLEYLGRRDEQIKFHGHRVELNAVRIALNSHPKIRDSVVAIHPKPNGWPMMVAYYVSRDPLSGSELREFLSAFVLDDIIPNLFVHIQRVPLTQNGKINYKALPSPVEALNHRYSNTPRHRTPVEEIVAGIWTQLLRLERVAPADNFFEIGGHSLLATQIISRINKIFRLSLPLRLMFELPVLDTLADFISKQSGQQDPETIPAVPQDEQGSYPLSYAQRQLWFIDQLKEAANFYNISAAIWLRGSLLPSALAQALQALVARHGVLRTSFPVVDGRPVQRVAAAVNWRLSFVDLSALDADLGRRAAQTLAQTLTRQPFSLATGPLFRAALLRLQADEHLLVMSVHHIVCDGWSIGLLFSELNQAYTAFSRGSQPDWVPLLLQYTDFARWQHSWLASDALNSQLAWWREQLTGTPGVLELPTDYPRPAMQSFRGATLSLDLDSELTAQLQALCHREGVTLFMLLLAAFQLLLARYSGQQDIVVGSPIAGRTRAELEGLLGCFVNILLLRTQISGDLSFRQLLAHVRETCLDAYAHQDVPFEKLVEELQPVRDLSRQPLFQVMFVFQNTPAPQLALPNLQWEAQQLTNTIAKFDLILELSETHQGTVDGHIEYNLSLFTEPTIRRMKAHFKGLLVSILADLSEPVSSLDLLSVL
jgi:amino acid adenylation domain-containing protein